ncbi:rRNA pseudouridine synthase [Aerococcaceae bacterium NML130460]|nr:rRNA pseudouridine synthase [Aerococcaceae bacterium NML130460]
MRLDKLLVATGFGSRKEVKALLKSGQVTLNSVICKKAETKVDVTGDSVEVAGQSVRYQEYYYYLLNKPAGVISATEDHYQQTVIDWLGDEYRHRALFPVGRLDIDTTGLLLLTNNGQLAHQLLSPKKKVTKRYRATIEGVVTQTDVEQFAEGLDLGDFITQPAQLSILYVNEETATSEIEVTIMEGKFHQVKRMFRKVGKTVTALHRVAMGPLVLEETLAVGDWRELTEAEMLSLADYGVGVE